LGSDLHPASALPVLRFVLRFEQRRQIVEPEIAVTPSNRSSDTSAAMDL
jgi:hypothetical protein